MISYDIINNLASKVSFVSFVINIYEGNTKVVYIRRWRYETVFLTKVFFNVNILRNAMLNIMAWITTFDAWHFFFPTLRLSYGFIGDLLTIY